MPTAAKFAIQNGPEIIRKLTLLHKQGCLIAVKTNDSKESYLSAIINIDKDKKTLIIDCSPSEQLNSQILSAKETHLSSEISGIKVEFTQQNITKITQAKQYYFSMPLPESLLWIEHREFYRVRSPLSQPATCKITFPSKEEHSFNIFDISLSGLAITLEVLEDDFSDTLLNEDNTIFPNSTISLPETGDFICTLEIRNQRSLNPDKPDKIQLVGAQFSEISPATESKIQRYIQYIERENRKKS